MKNLKNKVFFTLLCIINLSILIIIGAFNMQTYFEQKRSVENSLRISTRPMNSKKVTDEFKGPDAKPKDDEKSLDENVKFMDRVIYTVLIDDEDNIKDIINHSNNEIESSKITSVAEKILTSDNIEEKFIGNLYFEDYSYSYVKGNSLTILDNSSIKKSLLSSLKVSVAILAVSEIFVLLICKLITSWIIKPVKESFEKQKRFIADASHELKTPLSVIVASSELLEKNKDETKWIKNIKRECSRMNLLITDLLELASSENVRDEVLEIGNISKIVELTTLTFEGRAFEKGIKIKTSIKPDIMLKCDEKGIKQLVEILLDNAVSHSKNKDDVEISLDEKGSFVSLIVKNYGDKIPRGEEDKIFERFYRVDKSRNRDENRYGLGLSIAKNIVNKHNAKISASSENNTTTFKVVFKK